MATLLASLSSGKGSWAKIYGLINGTQWDKVILITNDFGKEKFEPKENVELIVLDLNLAPDLLSEKIVAELKNKNLESEVAINISSGMGDEHMALLSAALKVCIGIRFVFLKDNKVEELKLFS